jgi:hypothetical protein
MRILETQFTIDELKKIAKDTFGDLVKVVVDVDRELIAIDAELHADLEALLLDNGSLQKNLWGINFYPDLSGDDFVEFDSMINMRPAQGNMSRNIQNELICKQIMMIVNKWVKK